MSRSSHPPALPQIDVTVPQWRALERQRRRWHTVRGVVGRVGTLAGAAAASIGLFTDGLSGVSLLADAALTLTGVATLRLWKPEGHQRATASAMYVTPGASLAMLLGAEWWTPGIHPVWTTVEAAALASWTVGVWVVRPAETARSMLALLPPPPAELAPTVQPRTESAHPAARWWTSHVAIEGGPGQDTLLEDVERIGASSMRAVIRSAVPGRPVPDISIRALSALMDVPEDEIAIGPVPGRGASVRLLTIGNADEAEDLPTVWAKHIAPAAMPGAVLTGVRVGRPPTMATPDEEV